MYCNIDERIALSTINRTKLLRQTSVMVFVFCFFNDASGIEMFYLTALKFLCGCNLNSKKLTLRRSTRDAQMLSCAKAANFEFQIDTARCNFHSTPLLRPRHTRRETVTRRDFPVFILCE